VDNQRGLTLLELLIALGLVGLVGVIALLSLRLASHAWERGEAILDTAQRVRFLTDLLTRELSSALPYMVRLNENEQMVAFIGGPASVKFMTTAAALAAAVPDGGLREVTYALGSDALYRIEAPASDRQFLELGRGVSVPLEWRLAQFSLQYLQRSTGTWQESWTPKVISLKQKKEDEETDPADLFPGAVAASLTLKTEEGREERLPPVIIPIRSEFPPEPKAKPGGKQKRS
jgi:prepilin-type N-terminal cleavage/methylation domain-containing protein